MVTKEKLESWYTPKQKQSKREYSCAVWNSKDVFSIKIMGTGLQVKNWVETLVEDFNEPKFGYSGELWDEE